MREMIQDGLQLGVKLFVGEIEATTEDRNHAGYRYFDALSFKLA